MSPPGPPIERGGWALSSSSFSFFISADGLRAGGTTIRAEYLTAYAPNMSARYAHLHTHRFMRHAPGMEGSGHAP